jgi:protein TonB
VPIEVVTLSPAPPPPEPVPLKEPARPRRVEKITPPRIVSRDSQLEPPAPLPSLVERRAAAGRATDAVRAPAAAAHALLPDLPTPNAVPAFTVGLPTLMASSAGDGSEPTREGSAAEPGRLGFVGDVAAGASGGSGAGRSGGGAAGRGSDALEDIAGTAPGGGTGGPLVFARPQGGYQSKPAYPESARRRGIEGVTLLAFEVLANGGVGGIRIAQTAGHPDLDHAAVEAVKTWRFEPARRGTQAVAVWVTLPVRFELR